ncbi:MAG: hypothetical protein R6W96_07755 [Clostridia bacterium]
MKLRFLKKEAGEFFRTYRFLILFGVFLFFAFLNAPVARYMNELFALMGDMGFEFVLPDPVFTDSYAQFFKNLSTGMIVLIVIYMAVVSGEIRKGTAYLVLSKGLSRMDFYFSKLIFASLAYTLAYAVSALVTVLYTWLLFGAWHFDHMVWAMASYWLYGLMILLVTIGMSAITNSSGYSALAGFFILLFVPLTNHLGKIGRFFPGRLTILPNELMLATAEPGDMLVPALAALMISSVFVFLGAWVFSRKEL